MISEIQFLATMPKNVRGQWFSILNSKRSIYQACVLSMLLYGCESLTLLRRHLKRPDSFPHRCIRSVLGIMNRQQWLARISSRQVRERWCDLETMSTKVQQHRLKWLGRLARMSDNRMPKIALFSWLTTPHPCWGMKRRWRDLIKKDLVALKIPLDIWYDQTQNRKSWCEFCSEGTLAYHQLHLHQLRQQQTSRTIECNICGDFFAEQQIKLGINVEWTSEAGMSTARFCSVWKLWSMV